MGLDVVLTEEQRRARTSRLSTARLESLRGSKGASSMTNIQRAISSSRSNPAAAFAPGSTILAGKIAESPGGTTLVRTG